MRRDMLFFFTVAACRSPRAVLFKILDARREQSHIGLRVALRSVFEHELADAFAVSHLAEHSAVGACDALYRKHRAVGIERALHGRATVHVAILRRYLTVFDELVDHRFIGKELALAVGHGHLIDVADVRAVEPRA